MKLDIVRAWKDEAYRESLTQEQQAQLPANPAGELEMSDADLAMVVGAGGHNDCYDPCDDDHRHRSYHRHSSRNRSWGGDCYSSRSYRRRSYSYGDC